MIFVLGSPWGAQERERKEKEESRMRSREMLAQRGRAGMGDQPAPPLPFGGRHQPHSFPFNPLAHKLARARTQVSHKCHTTVTRVSPECHPRSHAHAHAHTSVTR
eukprot:8228409-Pyramimonas_sp.AAC.1